MGVGNRQQQIVGLQHLLALQEKALPVGLSSLQKIYSGLSKFTEALGFANGKQFFVEPPPDAQYQPSPPHQVLVAQIKAQSDVMVEYLKAHTDQTLAQMKEQATDVRTWFEENMQLQNEREERIVRLVSEQTERMQEMRLENARAAGASKPSVTKVSISGKEIEKSVEESKGAAASAAKLAQTAIDAVDEMKKKPKKRKIKAPSGKTYEVEDM
jgi:hypothetical protein